MRPNIFFNFKALNNRITFINFKKRNNFITYAFVYNSGESNIISYGNELIKSIQNHIFKYSFIIIFLSSTKLPFKYIAVLNYNNMSK